MKKRCERGNICTELRQKLQSTSLRACLTGIYLITFYSRMIDVSRLGHPDLAEYFIQRASSPAAESTQSTQDAHDNTTENEQDEEASAWLVEATGNTNIIGLEALASGRLVNDTSEIRARTPQSGSSTVTE